MHSNNMNKQMTTKQTFGVQRRTGQLSTRPAFYKQDDFGNFAYGYNSGNSEQFVMGNPEEGVKGHYTYVDGNGLNRRVEYVADNEGFRIIKDSDRSGMRLRREAEAEPAMTMTSVMDSSLMRNDDHQIQRSSLMPTMSMYRNIMLDGRHQQSMSSDRHMSDMRMSDRQMSDRQMYRNIMMGDNMMNNRNMMMQEDNMNNMMNNRNMMMMQDNLRNKMSNVMNHNIYNMNNLDSMNMDNMNMNNMQMR